jgi:cell division protein FtsL
VRHHRRVSGAARPAPRRAVPRAGAVAAPRVPQLPFGALAERATAAVCALRDSQLVDRLVRGQGWIALLGVLLIGLVGLNVSLLKLNAQNGRAAELARDLRIENAKLRGSVSRLGSSDRLQKAARELGLVMPTPQMVNYLTARPDHDGRQAAKNVRQGAPPPTDEQLVSASPEAERELAAPTPSMPLAQAIAENEAENAAAGTTGATGAVAPTAPATGATGATGPAGSTGTPGG